jgi:hypothetical protein
MYINPKGMIGMPLIDFHVWGHAYEHDNNVGITNVDEQKACYVGKETKGLEVTQMKGKMMSQWRGVILSYRQHSKPLACLTFSPSFWGSIYLL